MKIKFEYFGQLGEIVKTAQTDVELPDGASLVEALTIQADLHGDACRRIIFDEKGALRPSAIFLVNDEAIDRDAPPTLKDGDVAAVLPAIAGGC